MNRFLRDLWPEQANILFDTTESVVTLPIGQVTTVVKGNPQRVGLILAVPQTFPMLSFSTVQNAAAQQGLTLASPILQFAILGPGWEPLAALPWFGNNAGGGAASVTALEVILSRPALRPAMPPVVVTVDQSAGASDMIRRILTKHAKWRQRVLRELERRRSSAKQQRVAGAGLAAVEPADVRQSQSNLRQLRQSPRIFARPTVGGHGS